MTQTEFEKEMSVLREERELRKKMVRETEIKMCEVMQARAESLATEYYQYDGKKVKIEFESTERMWSGKEFTQHKEVVGFLKGFSYMPNYMSKGIQVRVAKVKKDGTPSLNMYSEYETMSAEYIKSITIVDG